MAERSDLADLRSFTAIAQLGSFRRAADMLGVTTSALSHAMRKLEERLGVRLLNRTNRSVTLTAAGEALLVRLDAGFEQIDAGIEMLQAFRETPSGKLRINVPRAALGTLIEPILPAFLRSHPELDLEIHVEDNIVDIVAGGFDAGIRFGGTVPEDMIATRLTPDIEWIVVGSPSYLAEHGVPSRPADLAHHRCIRLRAGRGAIYRWELGEGQLAELVDVPGPLLANDLDLAISAARGGAGLAYCQKFQVAFLLDQGDLVHVLKDWTSVGQGYHLYYPSRRQLHPGLRNLVTQIRHHQQLG